MNGPDFPNDPRWTEATPERFWMSIPGPSEFGRIPIMEQREKIRAVIEIDDVIDGHVAAYRPVCSCLWVGESTFYVDKANAQYLAHWAQAHA